MLDNNGYKNTFTFKCSLELRPLNDALAEQCRKQLKTSIAVLDRDSRKWPEPNKMSGTIRGLRMSTMSEPKYTLQLKPGGAYELTTYVADLISGGFGSSHAPGELFDKVLKTMTREGTVSGVIQKEKQKPVSSAESRQVYGMK